MILQSRPYVRGPKEKPPTWRTTFNSDLKLVLWGHVSKAADAAVMAGYCYLLWNDRVYCSFTLEDTGWGIEDIV